MHKNVRIMFLALAIVLCTLAIMAPPASAADQTRFCGYGPPSCYVNQDCVAYCQPCGYQPLCGFWSRDPTAPGFCACSL
jgi:hypothetical protein